MKRKMLSVISVVTTMSMLAGSLTGCGTQAQATDQVLNEETVIVIDTEASEETVVVPVATEEATPVVADLEDENIVLYLHKREQTYCPIDGTYESKNVSFTAGEQILLYDSDGYEVGYVKANGNITVTEYATNLGWDRFKNPISGTEYDYLYIARASIPNGTESASSGFVASTENIREEMLFHLNNRDVLPTILDVPTSDMEKFEIRVDKTFSSEEDFKSMMFYYYHNDDSFKAKGYMNYAIEVTEESDSFVCTVYYKD